MAGNGDGAAGGASQEFRARIKELKMLELKANMKREVNLVEEVAIDLDMLNKCDAIDAELQANIDKLSGTLLQEKLIKVETLQEVNTLYFLKDVCQWTGKAAVDADDPIADALVTHAKSLGVPVVLRNQSGEPLPEPEAESMV